MPRILLISLSSMFCNISLSETPSYFDDSCFTPAMNASISCFSVDPDFLFLSFSLFWIFSGMMYFDTLVSHLAIIFSHSSIVLWLSLYPPYLLLNSSNHSISNSFSCCLFSIHWLFLSGNLSPSAGNPSSNFIFWGNILVEFTKRGSRGGEEGRRKGRERKRKGRERGI